MALWVCSEMKAWPWDCWGWLKLSARRTLWDDPHVFIKLCFPHKEKGVHCWLHSLWPLLTLVIQSHCWPLSFLVTPTPSSQGQPAFSLAAHALSHNSASRASKFPLSELSVHVLVTCLHLTLGPWATSFSIYSLNQKQVLATIIIPILSVRGYDQVPEARLSPPFIEPYPHGSWFGGTVTFH